MSETSGSAAIASQTQMFAPIDPGMSKSDVRRIAHQEARKVELERKAESGVLTEREAAELRSINIEQSMDKLARLANPTICYMA